MTQHFTLREMIYSKTAADLGIDNYPDTVQLFHLFELAHSLELVREYFDNRKIVITSAFRSKALNKAVGGATNSAHLNGYAADFYVIGNKSTEEYFLYLKEIDMNINQCILEDTVIHLDITPGGKREFLVRERVNGGFKYIKLYV
jgi:zinc D-Ala-D-Ala carboxypeptidase